MTSDRTVQSIPPRHAADGRSPFAGRPLEGLVVLALEQMAALPFATQLMGRLGARIIKVEHPTDGESGRQSSPAMTDPEGRTVGRRFCAPTWARTRSASISSPRPGVNW